MTGDAVDAPGIAPLALPSEVERVLGQFVEAARSAFAEDLMSIVLFGSAAESRLRPTSDVNLIVVLSRFQHERADRLREAYRLAHAAVQLEAMFITTAEVPAAAESFAVKFADIRRRHRVLFGPDPFAALTVSRQAELARVRQVLLNLVLRLRERYLLVSLRDEQAGLAIADAVGPLRASAAALCELEGRPASSPREALERMVASLPGGPWKDLLAHLHEARERALRPGEAGPTLLRVGELAAALHAVAERLR